MKKLPKIIFFIFIIIFTSFFKKYLYEVIGFFLKPKYIVLLYPGNSADASAYLPKWAYERIKFPFPIGIITGNGKVRPGLMVAIPDKSSHLVKNKKRCLQIKNDLVLIRTATGAKKVAMVGLLPTIFLRHSISLNNGIVSGLKGTLFSVITTLKIAMEEHSLLKQDQITIIGLGRIGIPLLKHLESNGYNVAGIDKGGNFHKKKSLLSKSKIVISFVSGKVLENIYLKKELISDDCIIVDDAHPMLVDPHGHTAYRVLAICPGVRYLPTIPGYKPNQLAGCMVSAAIQSSSNEPTGSLEDFLEQAKDLGFGSELQRM